MAARPRTTLLAASVGLALAPFVTTQARADSAVGTDTTQCSAMNQGIAAGPPYLETEFDLKRSPIGILYDYRDLLAPRKKAPDGWEYKSQVELGALGSGGDKDNPLYRRYRDLDSGFYLHHLTVEADKPATAAFFEAHAGSVGRDDQFHSLAFGRHNDWKVKAFLNETPSYSTNTFRSLWNGRGSANQALATLTPGGLATPSLTQAALQNAIAAAPGTELAITRTKGGIRADLKLSEAWKAFAGFSSEKKQGASPYAMGFGGAAGGGNIEIIEPIDATTHEFSAGASYFDRVSSFNLILQGSLYRNDIGTFTVQNPLAINVNTLAGVPAGTFTSARFDSYPDNDFYKAKAEYARNLPGFMNARLSIVAAATRSTQDDALIAPTTLPLTGGTINGVSTANVWNTTAALTRQSAGAEIDTRLAHANLAIHPSPAVAVRATWRHYETHNSTAFIACNPLTGQIGRLLNDGSGGAFVNTPAYLATRCDLAAVRALGIAPSAGNINIRSVPFEYRQDNYILSADWRPGMKSNLTAALERETYRRRHRERDETREDKLKLGYTDRRFESLTMLLSYEVARRRGSEYHADPYGEFLSASLGPLPTAPGTDYASWIHVMDTFQKYDLADRDSRNLNGRLNWAVAENVDVGLQGIWRDQRYPASAFGRNGANRVASLNLDINWQASPELALHGYYTWQDQKTHQTGLQGNSCVVGTTYYFFSDGSVSTIAAAPAGTTLVGSTQVAPGDAGLSVCRTPGPLSPLYPTSRSWEQAQHSKNHTAGVGLRRDFGTAKLDLSYSYTMGRTSTDYAYNPAAFGFSPAQVALIGTGMPESRFGQSTLEASLGYPLTKAVAVRLYYRYERGRITDWHYDGVRENPVPAPNAVYLDSGPRDYEAHTVGLFLRIDL